MNMQTVNGFDTRNAIAIGLRLNSETGADLIHKQAYWIKRDHKKFAKPEIAIFHKSEPGTSTYYGKWQVFGNMTKIYHTDTIKVYYKINTPNV